MSPPLESSGSNLSIELTPLEESMVNRADSEAALRIDGVNRLIELGITRLEKPTAGTSKKTGSERANRKYRLDYLKNQLDIDASNLVGLGERLVADVAFDVVGLCTTVEDLIKTNDFTAASAEIDLFNALAEFRQVKARRSTEVTSTGETRHERGMKFQYSVGRGDNPAQPGEFAAILKAVVIGLKRKQLAAPPQP